MNEANPLVTVYIPTFNRVDLLKRAVDSVLNQTYKNIEVIIVDDCSTDGTHDYLSKLAKTDQRVVFFVKEKNSGACTSRNIAIENAKGEYITGLDDDDYFGENHIDIILKEYLLRKEDGVKHAIFPSISGIVNGEVIALKQKMEKVTLKNLTIRNCIGNQCFAKKSSFVEANMFDENMPAWQDYDMWVRMAKKGVIFYKASISSYFYDIELSTNRISDKGYIKLELAYQRFISKNFSDLSEKDKLRLKLNLYNYPQVPMGFEDLFQYIGEISFFRAFKIFFKKKFMKQSKQNFT